MEAYHDLEWGTPLHDDRALFELLTLEGAQAGLSWITILRRREGYRRAFVGFDPVAVAAFDSAKTEALLANPEIIRNRQKVALRTRSASWSCSANMAHSIAMCGPLWTTSR